MCRLGAICPILLLLFVLLFEIHKYIIMFCHISHRFFLLEKFFPFFLPNDCALSFFLVVVSNCYVGSHISYRILRWDVVAYEFMFEECLEKFMLFCYYPIVVAICCWLFIFFSHILFNNALTHMQHIPGYYCLVNRFNCQQRLHLIGWVFIFALWINRWLEHPTIDKLEPLEIIP